MLQGWLQIAIFLAVLTALTPLLGGYMARVYSGERVFLSARRRPGRAAALPARCASIRQRDRTGRPTRAACCPLGLFWLALYLILRTQTLHPFNPQGFHSGTWDVTFNTTSSFVTNTNWQYYGGETTMTLLQPDGGAGGAELRLGGRRHLRRDRADPRDRRARRPQRWATSGRTWCARCCTCCCRSRVVGALVLVSQGVIQTLASYATRPRWPAGRRRSPSARSPRRRSIKELGTNGGGFFNVNSAHPFENPHGLSNFVEMLADPAHPGGADRDLRTDGRQPPPGLGDLRGDGDPVRRSASRSSTPPSSTAPRRSISPASAPTTSRLHGRQPRGQGAALRDRQLGALDGRHDRRLLRRGQRCVRVAHRPRRRRAVGQHLMSEVVFGGVGSGLYSMLIYVLLAVFIGGLMVGRTPEYLGKKIEAREIKLLSLGALFTPLAALITSATAIASPAGRESIAAAGPAGLLGDPLRLPLAGQQQRLGVRRLHGLRPARARQPRRLRHHLRRPARRR